MTPRDYLVQDLAAFLHGCHVSRHGSVRIRIGFPGLGAHGEVETYLAVSKSGRRVVACDSQGRAPADTGTEVSVVDEASAAGIAIESVIRKCWVTSMPSLRQLEVLAALGFDHEVPELARKAAVRLDRERVEVAEKIKALQALDSKLACEADAYRALMR